MITKLLVKKILEQAHNYEWSIQGFGMFRLYLSDEVRLHIWDSTYKVPNCTLIHDHPWNFYSEIIAGVLYNTRYDISDPRFSTATSFLEGKDYDEVTIKAGEGAVVISQPRQVLLFAKPKESYNDNCNYTQNANEVHETSAEIGTVTLVTRTMREDKHRDHAKVYCVPGVGFISAAPRAATFEEISGAARRSLERWF